MNLKELKKAIRYFVKEYTGTGASGGNSTDGNDITSPRVGGSFLTDEDEMMNYLYKNVYGGDGGHYTGDMYTGNYPNRHKMPKFEFKKIVKKVIKELNEQAYGSATLTTQGPPRTGAIAPTDEYPFSVRPKRTATGMYEQNNPYKMGEHPDFKLLIKTVTEDLNLKVDETVRGGSYNGREGYYLRIDYRDLTFWSKDQIETLKKTFDKVNEMTEEFTFEYEGVSDRDDEPGERIIEAGFSFFAESKFKKQYMSKISPEDFKNKIKVGRKVKYMGSSFTVLSNDGFVLELEDEDGNKKTVNLNQFSHGGMVTEQISKAEQQTYERGLKRLQKNVLRYQLRFIEKQRSAAVSQAATASSQTSKGFDQQIKAIQDQMDAIDNPPKQKKQNEGMEPCSVCGKRGHDKMHHTKHDHEGKMAKSQLYKIHQYTKRLMHMLPDNAQLPAWVQAKFTKAAHNIGAAFHYLDYEMVSHGDNLMENLDTYKKEALLEGTVKNFFSMFKKGKTNEEVLRHYAEKGITIPETFLTKVRKQYENVQKQKLEIKFTEQEAKDIFSIPQKGVEPILFNLGDEEKELYDEKKLSSRLFKEGKIKKKYPIPPEIENALVDTLKMDPLIRFVKNLKAINSIPPSYRVFLLNGKYFDVIYKDYSLMVKIGIDEYYLGDIEDRNYAIKHINRLMVEPILKTGDEETTPSPASPPTPTPSPPPPSPEEPEA